MSIILRLYLHYKWQNHTIKNGTNSPARCLCWLERGPVHQKVVDLIPGPGTLPGLRV